MNIVNRIIYTATSPEAIDLSTIKNDLVDHIILDLTRKLSDIDYGTHEVTFYLDGHADQLFDGHSPVISFIPTSDADINLRIHQTILDIHTQ